MLDNKSRNGKMFCDFGYAKTSISIRMAAEKIQKHFKMFIFSCSGENKNRSVFDKNIFPNL